MIWDFAGNFNSNVNSELKNNRNCDKIIIGKKIMKTKCEEDVILAMTKENYMQNTSEIENVLLKCLQSKKYSKVNLIYNHYYNISKMELVKKQLLPLDNEIIARKDKKHKEDFVVEGNINEILMNIITLYISYEIKIATENSYASENIQRQTLTKKSLKKIEEIEEEAKNEERNKKKIKDNTKLLDSIIKTKRI